MLAGTMAPVIRKHQPVQQLLSACLKSSSTSEKLLNNQMATQYLQRARNQNHPNGYARKMVKTLGPCGKILFSGTTEGLGR